MSVFVLKRLILFYQRLFHYTRTRSLNACFQGFFRCLFKNAVNLASSGVILGAFKLKHSSLQLIFIFLTLLAGRMAARATVLGPGLPTAITHREFSTGGRSWGGHPVLDLRDPPMWRTLEGAFWKEQGVAGTQNPRPLLARGWGPCQSLGGLEQSLQEEASHPEADVASSTLGRAHPHHAHQQLPWNKREVKTDLERQVCFHRRPLLGTGDQQ